MRRALVSLMAISILRLTQVGGDIECRSHESAAATVPVTSAHAEHGTPVDRDSNPPCPSPGLPDCCRMISTCSAEFSASVVDAGTLLPREENGFAAPVDQLTSIDIAPDTPPPRG